MQKLTGENFEYRRDGSQEERLSSIKKAQKWWKEYGAKKYSYDSIEKMIESQ